MEESVGAFWHKMITRMAEKHYPREAMTLADMGKTAAIFFRALGGDGGLSIQSTAANIHGARRSLLQRIAGIGEKIELSWFDENSLHLPSVLDILPQRALNRDLYLWLIALAAVEKSQGLSWVIRSQQATLTVFEQFPGIRSRYERLLPVILSLRPDPHLLPDDEALLERMIRTALTNPGSVDDLPSANRPPYPVHLWLHPNSPLSVPDNTQPSGESTQENNSNRKKSVDAHYRQAERVAMPDNKNPFMLFFRAESIFSWSEYIKANRASEENNDPNVAQTANDLNHLSVARDEKRAASCLRFDFDLPSAVQDDEPLGADISLPEWHYRKQILQPNHCCLRLMGAHTAPPCPLPCHLSVTARRLRSQFAALTSARIWTKGQFDGIEPDLDACVQFTADRMTGRAAERGLYRFHHYRDRDFSCLLLADFSLSTDAWVSNSARVIDVIRDSLFLFSEALSATGDKFSLYGFSSLRRDNVRFHVLKEFDEKYNAAIRGRINAIRPGYYTRMGAAVRYASQLLLKQESAQQILFILTDGKPNDLDQYEGRYGIEDTRVALIEARRMGLRTFCVTIDEKASDYLPHLFGIGGYVVIRNPAELPKQLPLLYAQLTR